MSKTKEKKDSLTIILDIIIIAMVFVVIGVGYRLYYHYSFAKDASNFMQDSHSMAFELERNDYATLIQGKYINEINGDTSSKDYHALADYVEAAFNHKIYEGMGYTEKAHDQKEIMNESLEDMGSLTIFAEQADEMFE